MIKHEILLGTGISIGDGEGTSFGLIRGSVGSRLAPTSQPFLRFCSDPMLLVASAVCSGNGNISFQQIFRPEET